MIDYKAGTQKRTALHLAVLSSTAQAVQMLLDYGANPNEKDASGTTARQMAIHMVASHISGNPKGDDKQEILDRIRGR
jgi:ankyrin repeat protein